MRGEFGTILVFLAAGAAFVLICVGLSLLIQPRNPDPEKLATYECGEEPEGEARIRYNFRFYTVALTFIIFEAEILFMFPWSIIFGDEVAAGNGLITFIKGIIFVLILALGLVYAWAKGDLDWVKPRPSFTAEDVEMPEEAIFKHHEAARTARATTAGE